MSDKSEYGKCCICGDKDGQPCTNLCGNLNYYCEQCLRKGLEVYEDLVGFGLHYKDFNGLYRRTILNPSLAHFKKTSEEFDADVDKILNERGGESEESNERDESEESESADQRGDADMLEEQIRVD